MTTKCDNCKLLGIYRTGADEYPQFASIPYCRKGHWEAGDIIETVKKDPWEGCKDFEQK
jgi:hypothetical protein